MECTAIKDKYNVMESDQAKGVNTIVVLQLLIIRKVYHQDKYPTAWSVCLLSAGHVACFPVSEFSLNFLGAHLHIAPSMTKS